MYPTASVFSHAVIGVMITMTSNTRTNLTLAYNPQYTVSIVADICGQRNSTALIKLNYGMCNVFRVNVVLCTCNIKVQKTMPNQDNV